MFADTQELQVGQRGLGLLCCLGSFNTSTIVTTNLCNSNIFRDQNFGDVPWGGTPTARDWWAIKKWTVRGGTIFLGDQSRQTVRSVWFEKCLNLGVDLLYEVRGGRDGLQHQPLALLH